MKIISSILLSFTGYLVGAVLTLPFMNGDVMPTMFLVGIAGLPVALLLGGMIASKLFRTKAGLAALCSFAVGAALPIGIYTALYFLSGFQQQMNRTGM